MIRLLPRSGSSSVMEAIVGDACGVRHCSICQRGCRESLLCGWPELRCVLLCLGCVSKRCLASTFLAFFDVPILVAMLLPVVEPVCFRTLSFVVGVACFAKFIASSDLAILFPLCAALTQVTKEPIMYCLCLCPASRVNCCSQRGYCKTAG